MSPTVYSESTDMSENNNDNLCRCKEGETCNMCSVSETMPKAGDFRITMNLLIGKLDRLTEEVTYLRRDCNSQKQRVDYLESVSRVSGGEESIHDTNNSAASATPSQASGKARAAKSKKVRVVGEKERTLNVALEQLDQVNLENTTQSENSASDIFGLKPLRKQKYKKNVSNCHRSSSSYKRTRDLFSDEDFDSFSSSSAESSEIRGRSSRRDKVKSGAKIKTRPVVKTELWPHTISNEEEGEETTSEDIGLTKFLTCFTHIMIKCGKVESVGRAMLLHAVCMVFQCLSWTEARTFHNLIMVKVEQDRINWNSDFKILANQYLDNKVRLSMRSRGSSASGSGSYSHKPNANSNFGKGPGFGRADHGYSVSNRMGSSNSSKSKSLYPLICKQWNYGTCSYGEQCKKFHVCWSCAEAGKLGEQHKASTHDSASGKDGGK